MGIIEELALVGAGFVSGWMFSERLITYLIKRKQRIPSFLRELGLEIKGKKDDEELKKKIGEKE